MTTYDLTAAQRSVSPFDLRRTNLPVALLLVVLLASAVGLVGHAGEQAAQRRADRLEHARQVAQRVDALEADRRVEQSFLDSAAARARTRSLTSVAAERAAVATARDLALTDAAQVLASSLGKVDEAQRDELAGAIVALNAAGPVYSQITSASGTVATLTGEVAVAEAAWTAEQQAARRAAVTHVANKRASVAAAPVAAGSIRDVGESTLRALPGNGGITIHWDDPDLSGHLGAVWSGNTSYMMVNSQRLAGNPGKTRDVVKHEIAHIYQGRLAAAAGLSWGELNTRMSAAFGSSATEKAADCVALRFGASWTNYTSDCSGADKQAWVDAMIGGYLP